MTRNRTHGTASSSSTTTTRHRIIITALSVQAASSYYSLGQLNELSSVPVIAGGSCLGQDTTDKFWRHRPGFGPDYLPSPQGELKHGTDFGCGLAGGQKAWMSWGVLVILGGTPQPHIDPLSPRTERTTSPLGRKKRLAVTTTWKTVSWLQLWTSWWTKGLDGFRRLSNAWWCKEYRSWVTAYKTGDLISCTEDKSGSYIQIEGGFQDNKYTVLSEASRSHIYRSWLRVDSGMTLNVHPTPGRTNFMANWQAYWRFN